MYNLSFQVALQFPDELLMYSVAVSQILEKQTRAAMFILADTTFGRSCKQLIDLAPFIFLFPFFPPCILTKCLTVVVWMKLLQSMLTQILSFILEILA